MADQARSAIDHLVTSGTFSLDGGTWEVDNNVWIVGDEREVLVIDAAHSATSTRPPRCPTDSAAPTSTNGSPADPDSCSDEVWTSRSDV